MQFAFEFWEAMVTLFGTRWIAKHGDTPSPEWQRMLSRYAAENPKAIAARIARQLKPNGRGEVWPPEMVDVVAMCQPSAEECGLPSADRAYRDASHHRWGRHPVIYETARRVGVYEVRTDARSRPDFEREYEKVCAEWMAGRRFEVPQVERLERKPADPDRAKTAFEAHIAARKNILGGAA